MKSFLRYAATVVFIMALVPTGVSPAISEGQTYAALDPGLVSLLETAALSDSFEVVLTFYDRKDMGLLDLLGIGASRLRALPIAGAVLTKAQILDLAGRPQVRSIYWNAPLEYHLFEASEITGVHAVHCRQLSESGCAQVGFTGQGVTIAVVDSGIDATHPDLLLGQKTIQNVHVVEALGATEPVILENVDHTDTGSGHGSHVAGIAAGSGDASLDTTDTHAPPPAFERWLDGVAPGAKLVGATGGSAVIVLFNTLAALDWIIANHAQYGIRVENNSWGPISSAGFDPSSPVNVATYELYQRGITVTFSAGNAGPNNDTMNAHSLAPWVISVGAGDKNKGLAGFSSRGVPGDPVKHPDIVAPGVRIVAPMAKAPLALDARRSILLESHDYSNHVEYSTSYFSLSGTSMAAPFTAGSVALLLEANPDLSPDQIQEVLFSTAEAMPGREFHEVGHGFINVRAAVDKALATQGNLKQFLNGKRRFTHCGETVDPLRKIRESSLSFSDTMPPSTELLDPILAPQVKEFPFEVTRGQAGELTALQATLSWTGVADLDLFLVGPDGRVIDSGATLNNPEVSVGCTVETPGTYRVRVVGFANAEQPFDVTVTKMVVRGGQASTSSTTVGAPAKLAIRATPNLVKGLRAVRFAVNGEGINSLRVQVFDLSGRSIFDSGYVQGNRLQWHLKNTQGRIVANGLYLYLVSVRGSTGEMIRGEVKKLVILR